MRDLLAHADLARYAGQFVWLELSYDEARNRLFLNQYGASATPTFFVIDSRDQRLIASQLGVMSLPELEEFLERGLKSTGAMRQTPADLALRRGDALIATQPAAAAKAYGTALQLAPAAWSQTAARRGIFDRSPPG